jgi:hypothetical protein
VAKREVHTAAFLADRVRRPPRGVPVRPYFCPHEIQTYPILGGYETIAVSADVRVRAHRTRESCDGGAAPLGRSSSSEPTMLAKCVRITRIRLDSSETRRRRKSDGAMGAGRHILALIGPAARGSSIGSAAMMLGRRHRIASCSRRAGCRQGAEAAQNSATRLGPTPVGPLWVCPVPLSGSFSDPTPVSAARRLLRRRGGAHRRRSTQRLAATAPCSTPLHRAGSAPTPPIGARGADDGRGGGSWTGRAGRR